MGILDLFDTKKEVALSLAGLTIGGLVSLTLVDFGTVAAGIKDTVALPSEMHFFATSTGTAFLGYLLGKKQNENKETS